MSVKKAFVFSFVVFILLNFMFTIIYFSMQGRLSYYANSIDEKPLRLLFYLLQPIFIFPWDIMNSFFLFSEPHMIALLFGFIFSLLIASIIAGIYGTDAIKAFCGWCLTVLICLTMWLILISCDSTFRYYINSNILLEQAIITLAINGIITCLIYGSCASFFSFLKTRISDFD